MNEDQTPNTSEQEEGPQKIIPFFKSWRQLYIFVLVELAVLIVLFYIFSETYS